MVVAGVFESWLVPVDAIGLAVAELDGVDECFGSETEVGLEPHPPITMAVAANKARETPFTRGGYVS